MKIYRLFSFIALVSIPVLASKFQDVSSCVVTSNALRVSAGALFTSATLQGAGKSAVVTLTAIGSATYACINNGGNTPAATNEQRTTSSEVSATITFGAVGSSGIRVCIAADPPPVPADFSCPSGQFLQTTPISVTYANATLTNVGGTASFEVAGIVSAPCSAAAC